MPLHSPRMLRPLHQEPRLSSPVPRHLFLTHKTTTRVSNHISRSHISNSSSNTATTIPIKINNTNSTSSSRMVKTTRLVRTSIMPTLETITRDIRSRIRPNSNRPTTLPGSAPTPATLHHDHREISNPRSFHSVTMVPPPSPRSCPSVLMAPLPSQRCCL